jgi:hypothetical protein
MAWLHLSCIMLHFNRRTLKVISGEDLIERVALWNTSTNSYNMPVSGAAGYSFDRFCAADLPLQSAFWDEKTKMGTKDRIFMNGEETLNGKAFAHVVSHHHTSSREQLG